MRSTTLIKVVRAFSVCALVAAAGCGGGPKVVPVSGIATLDGQPLSGFGLQFNPEVEARLDCTGYPGGDGSYSVITDDSFDQYKGAPPGKYKVTIFSPNDKPILANKRYTNVQTTDMIVEVKADAPPGAYDLKFTTK
jgi:hypothetical protein